MRWPAGRGTLAGSPTQVITEYGGGGRTVRGRSGHSDIERWGSVPRRIPPPCWLAACWLAFRWLAFRWMELCRLRRAAALLVASGPLPGRSVMDTHDVPAEQNWSAKRSVPFTGTAALAKWNFVARVGPHPHESHHSSAAMHRCRTMFRSVEWPAIRQNQDDPLPARSPRS